MSRHWKPGRDVVPLRPSRIRRKPVRLETVVPTSEPSPEKQVWAAVLGIALVAACCASLVIGISHVTSYQRASAAPPAGSVARFGFCRNGGGPDCILDGDTFFMDGAKVEIAGIDAPEIHPSRCASEARLGTQAAVRLHRLLNNGTITVIPVAGTGAAPGTGKVEANGVDVAQALVAMSVARDYAGGAARGWC